MKKYYFLLVISLFACFSSYAQDTIIFRNGDELLVKVTEVSDTEIKYQLWANQSGPTYRKNLIDIFMIKYNSGYKEVYDQVQNNAGNQKYLPSRNEDYFMYRRRSYLEIGGKVLTDEEMKQLLTQNEYETFESALKQKKFGLSGFLTGVFLDIVGSVMITSQNNGTKSASLYASGLSLIIIGDIISSIGLPFCFIANGRMNWVARSYNSRQTGEPLSMSFHPSLISSPDKTGSNNYCYGLGMTLSF